MRNSSEYSPLGKDLEEYGCTWQTNHLSRWVCRAPQNLGNTHNGRLLAEGLKQTSLIRPQERQNALIGCSSRSVQNAKS
jgi:hypothetical protein